MEKSQLRWSLLLYGRHSPPSKFLPLFPLNPKYSLLFLISVAWKTAFHACASHACLSRRPHLSSNPTCSLTPPESLWLAAAFLPQKADCRNTPATHRCSQASEGKRNMYRVPILFPFPMQLTQVQEGGTHLRFIGVHSQVSLKHGRSTSLTGKASCSERPISDSGLLTVLVTATLPDSKLTAPPPPGDRGWFWF